MMKKKFGDPATNLSSGDACCSLIRNLRVPCLPILAVGHPMHYIYACSWSKSLFCLERETDELFDNLPRFTFGSEALTVTVRMHLFFGGGGKDSPVNCGSNLTGGLAGVQEINGRTTASPNACHVRNVVKI
jgi:hypothetical protein